MTRPEAVFERSEDLSSILLALDGLVPDDDTRPAPADPAPIHHVGAFGCWWRDMTRAEVRELRRTHEARP